MKFEHIDGKDNLLADSLSRLVAAIVARPNECPIEILGKILDKPIENRRKFWIRAAGA